MKKSPSKRFPQAVVGGNFDSAEIDDELFQNAPAINPSTVSLGASRGSSETNQYRINVPQRIEPPKDLNMPARNEYAALKTDEDDSAAVGESAPESPDAVASLGKNLSALAMNKKQALRLPSRLSHPTQRLLSFASLATCRRCPHNVHTAGERDADEGPRDAGLRLSPG